MLPPECHHRARAGVRVGLRRDQREREKLSLLSQGSHSPGGTEGGTEGWAEEEELGGGGAEGGGLPGSESPRPALPSGLLDSGSFFLCFGGQTAGLLSRSTAKLQPSLRKSEQECPAERISFQPPGLFLTQTSYGIAPFTHLPTSGPPMVSMFQIHCFVRFPSHCSCKYFFTGQQIHIWKRYFNFSLWENKVDNRPMNHPSRHRAGSPNSRVDQHPGVI